MMMMVMMIVMVIVMMMRWWWSGLHKLCSPARFGGHGLILENMEKMESINQMTESTLFMTQSTQFVNQMAQSTLLYGIHLMIKKS